METIIMFHDPKGEIEDITRDQYFDMIHRYVDQRIIINEFNPRRSALETVNRLKNRAEAYVTAFENNPPKNADQIQFKHDTLFDLYEDLREAEEQLNELDDWEKEVNRWVLILDRLEKI